MAVVLNSEALTYGLELIAKGNVDTTSDWSISPEDENNILGDPPDWKFYAKWHMGEDTGESEDSKGRYRYPYGKDDKVYRSALIAIRQRSAAQDETGIYEAAGKMIEAIDGEEEESEFDSLEPEDKVAAHDGVESMPTEGTRFLEGNEKIVQSKTSAQLKELIEGDGRAIPKDKETRNFVVDRLEVRNESGTRKIVGHAAIFNKDSEFMGFIERVAPGAFRSSISRDDVRALFNHDANYVLGRNRAGTLKMREDDVGLKIEIDPPDTQFARDLMISMERGDITQMSFGFYTRKDKWDYSGEVAVRTLEEVELFDVSPVTFPAYQDTDVAVRSMSQWKEKPDDSWKIEIEDLSRRLDLTAA